MIVELRMADLGLRINCGITNQSAIRNPQSALQGLP
jgi:hypothetical protein